MNELENFEDLPWHVRGRLSWPKTPRQLALSLSAGCALLLFLSLTLGKALREWRANINEHRARGVLRSIHKAQEAYRQLDREWKGVHTYGSLTRLSQAGLIDPELADGVQHGYRFIVVPGTDGTTDSEYVYWVAAEPLEIGRTGHRYLYTNQGACVYASDERPIRPKPGRRDNPASHGMHGGCR